ncbi:PKD domain-containing protein [Patescibacteria group bacterium]|nr:PKD domain-containing protein [Patescibacteria group bacterium]
MTDITVTLNNIPSATNLSREQTSGCGSAPIVRFSWDYNDDDNVPLGTDPQSAYEIQIDDDSNLDEDPIVTLSGGDSTSRDYSPPSFGTTYWWRVRVRDTNGPAWSGWANGPNLTPTKWPDPDFIWCPLEPDINETIQFCSVFGAGVCDQAAEPPCSDMASSADNLTTCAAGCNLWEWDFDNDGTPEITSTNNPTYSYSSSGDYRVRLTVTDAGGHSCFKQHDLSADIPLPIWKEIPPF